MQEVIFKFDDGSEYTVRFQHVGDTVMGAMAHEIMFAMGRHFNYLPPTLEDKINFIISYGK